MSQTTYDISVIICAYTEDRWNDLIAAVGSVEQQTLLPREIIVVIDCNPNSLMRVQQHLPGVIAVENREAKGAFGARNSVVTVTQRTVLAFLDDDAIAEPNWIESLAACYTDSKYVRTRIPVWRLASRSSAHSRRSMSSLFGCRHEDLLRHNGIYIISAALMVKTAGCCKSYKRHHAWKKWRFSDVYYV